MLDEIGGALSGIEASKKPVARATSRFSALRLFFFRRGFPMFFGFLEWFGLFSYVDGSGLR